MLIAWLFLFIFVSMNKSIKIHIKDLKLDVSQMLGIRYNQLSSVHIIEYLESKYGRLKTINSDNTYFYIQYE